MLPAFDVHEVHATLVRAEPLVIHRALFEVTAREILLFGALMALRGLGRGQERPADRPLLAAAQEGGFAILFEQPGRELVLGVMGRFWQLRQRSIRPIASPADFVAFAEPGFARAAMHFLIEPLAGGQCRLTTETRVSATDVRARRAFRAYWTVVHPGSAFIRRMWLRAIRRRAEASAQK